MNKIAALGRSAADYAVIFTRRCPRASTDVVKTGKFADTAIPNLVDRLARIGARPKCLKCKIVGGAQMFEIPGSRNKYAGLTCGPASHIGARNVDAVKMALEKLKIPIVGEETGGNHGRTVKFDSCTGDVEVSSIHFGKHTL